MVLLSAVALAATLAGCGSKAPTEAPHAHRAEQASTPRHPISRPRPATPWAHTAPLDGHDDDEPHASRTQVSSARQVARAFFTTYLAYLYGQLPASHVTGINQALRWQLEHGHTIRTPAERASPPHVARLSLTSSGPPISVTAIGLLATADSQPFQITATLEPHHGTWLVVAISG